MMNCLSYNIDQKNKIKNKTSNTDSCKRLGANTYIHNLHASGHVTRRVDNPAHYATKAQNCSHSNLSLSPPSKLQTQLNICLKVHMPSEKTKKVGEGKEEVHTLERR